MSRSRLFRIISLICTVGGLAALGVASYLIFSRVSVPSQVEPTPLAQIAKTPTPYPTYTLYPTYTPDSAYTPVATNVVVSPASTLALPTDVLVSSDDELSISGVIDESGVYCTSEGRGGKETIAVKPQRTIVRIRIDLIERALSQYGFSLREVKIYGPDDTELSIDDADALSVQDDENCIKEQCPFAARKAIDDDTSSRWSSDWYDEQWFEVTLVNPQVVGRIVLIWEEAFASEYCVEVIER